MAGAPGFEPGIEGPKPTALPLGYAPMATTGTGSAKAETISASARGLQALQTDACQFDDRQLALPARYAIVRVQAIQWSGSFSRSSALACSHAFWSKNSPKQVGPLPDIRAMTQAS